MTKLSQFFAIFPGLVLFLAGAAAVQFAMVPTLANFVRIPIVVYLLPLVVYRVHLQKYPLTPGVSYLGGDDYSPWWGSHQIQWIYVAFPFLEAALRAFPGLFSWWLRAWGSEIGEGVYWTPVIDIADRGLLKIGDGVVFGHRVGLFPHLVTPRRDDFMLYVSKITIGEGCFLGGGSVLGPGVQVDSGVMIPAGTHVLPREHVTE